MKRLVIAGLIFVQTVFFIPQQAQAQTPEPDPECALSTWVIRDGWVNFPGNILIWATNNTSTPVELRSITYQWTPSTYAVYQVGWNGNPTQYFDVNDTSGSYTATTSTLLQPGERAGITVIHDYPVTAPQWNDAICSSYTPPVTTSTPTPAPTGPAEAYNQWGRAMSTTELTDDFNTTMAAKIVAEGGAPAASGSIDFTPFEIPEPTLDIPALTLSMADISLMAKSATTLWALIDQLDVLPFYLLIAVALAVVWWLYRFVTDLPTPAPDIDLTGAMDAYTGYDDWQANRDLEFESAVRAGIDARGGRDSDIGERLYNDSLANTDALKERKGRNANRRAAVKGGVSTVRRFRKLF